MNGIPTCVVCGREITNRSQVAYAGDVPEWLHIKAPDEKVTFDHEAKPK